MANAQSFVVNSDVIGNLLDMWSFSYSKIYLLANEMVQNEVAQYSVYSMILGTFFPIFFSFYLGAWCDIFGRKLLFKLHAAARIIDLCIVITCAYFLESRKEFLLLASLPTAFVGIYFFTFHLSAISILNSFQVDIQFII